MLLTETEQQGSVMSELQQQENGLPILQLLTVTCCCLHTAEQKTNAASIYGRAGTKGNTTGHCSYK